MTSPLRIGNEQFWLDATDAAEVQRICVTDRQAGLSLARRKAHKASVRVDMLLMDASPPAPARPLHDAAPSPLPSQTIRTTPMTDMKKIRVGNDEHFVPDAVARHIQSLSGQNAALTAMAQGKVQPPTAQPVADALTSSRLAYRDSLRAEQARNDDPNTPQGRYRQYLQNAHRNPAGSRG